MTKYLNRHLKDMPVGRRTLQWFLLIFTAMLGACTQSEVVAPHPTVVEIVGATSMHPVLEQLTDAYATRNPNLLIELRGGGSRLGEQYVVDGRARLAGSTLMPDEQDETGNGTTSSAGTALVRTPIGIDGIALIVHERNPVSDLSTYELHDIFAGRVLNWQALGGDEADIVLISREDGSGTRAAFENRIMGDAEVSLTAIVMPTSRDVVDYVSKNPYAIGYVSSAYVADSGGDAASGDLNQTRDPPEVRVLAINSTYPTDETIQDQSYPLVQPLYLVTKSEPSGWTKQFIDFALSPVGQSVVDTLHVPVR